MGPNSHFSRNWRSCCANRVHGPKPLPRLCCAASATSALEPSRPPFGGAIVAKLAGSTKILKGEYHLVPLLGPGQQRAAGQPKLPFGASIECVRRSSQELEPHAPGSASTLRSDDWTDDYASGSSRMLDVLYVLAGTGIATSADGTVRRLHAGDSLVAWHNTCELRAVSPNDQPPAVLKFHFPASVLMLPPGAVVAPSPSHADLQILVNDCQGEYDGELSPQEAADMLSGVQQRASRAISHLYDSSHHHPQQQEQLQAEMPDRIQVESLPDPQLQVNSRQSVSVSESGAHGIVAAVAAPTAGPVPRPAPSSNAVAMTASNNILPAVGPFLRRLLHSAAAPAAGGVRLLRYALGRSPAAAAAAAAANPASAQSPLQHPHPQQPRRGCGGSFVPLGPSGRTVSHTTSSSSSAPSGCVLLQRALEDFKAFRFPRQTNKLAFVFDPAELGLSLSFGVEVFEPGHHTPLHIHKSAHELFFVLAGEGLAFCNGERFPVAAGDCVVFPPRAVHGIDNTSASAKLYCLQLMTPNEAFVEHVQSGEAVGRLDDEDLCNLTSRHC